MKMYYGKKNYCPHLSVIDNYLSQLFSQGGLCRQKLIGALIKKISFKIYFIETPIKFDYQSPLMIFDP